MSLAQKDQLLEIGSRVRLGTHHMQGIERPLRQIMTLAAHEVRTNLLFTMSNRTGGELSARRKLVLRMTFSLTFTRRPFFVPKTRKWWSRTGSNRRHPACKAGALPAELRPLIVFPDGYRESGGPGRT